MVGGLINSTSRLAVLAAAGIFAGGLALSNPAVAADLGGDCCADLEERVAELEATTVRHPNRKIFLELYGQVNTAVVWYDDGEESDIYVVDNDASSTRIGLKGKGKISPGWTAGFKIEFDIEVGNNAVTKSNDNDDSSNVQLRRANWWIRSDQLGTLSVGQGSMAADGALEVSFSDLWLSGIYSLASDGGIGNFNLLNSATLTGIGLVWFDAINNFDTSRRNRVRYDSPTIAGFTLSAAWGEDDEADVALRFSKEWNGLRVAAAAVYQWDDDDGDGPQQSDQTYGGSLAVWHVPTGIYVGVNYARREFDNGDLGRADTDADNWWVEAGIKKRFISLGMTNIGGGYGENDNDELVVGANRGLETTFWGIGLTQHIDAIGGSLYFGYKHYEADDKANVISIEDADSFTAGMRIKY